MTTFSTWANEFIFGEAKGAPAVIHGDIDRWLKSVDELAKDLKSLQDAKKKAGDKISRAGEKNKPVEKGKKDVDRPSDEIGDGDKPDDKRIDKRAGTPTPDKGGVGKPADDKRLIGKSSKGYGEKTRVKLAKKPVPDEENLE